MRILDFFHAHKKGNSSMSLRERATINLEPKEPAKVTLKDRAIIKPTPITPSVPLPQKTEDFKEYHVKLLRRLNKHPKNEPFTGIITKEIDIPRFIPVLEKLGLISTATYTETLSLLTLENLKQFLRENEKKVSGKKQELIERILSSIATDAVKSSSAYREFYVLTPAGQDAIKSCTARLEEENAAFFKNTVLMLTHKKIPAAYCAICKRNAEMSILPGMGIDWSEQYSSGLPSRELQLYLNILSESTEPLLTGVALFSILSGMSEHTANIYASKVFPVTAYSPEKLHAACATIYVKRDLQDFKDSGIEKYTFLATLDEKTCPICGALDGKSFPLTDAIIGKNCPPMHSECRCTIISYTPSHESAQMTRKFRNPNTGELESVSATMTYSRWKKIYLDE